MRLTPVVGQENDMKKVLYHAVLILVVFLGIFLGTLPDLWPSGLSCFPYFKKLDFGLAKLSQFSTPDAKNAYLNRNDPAYAPIYGLLRSLDSYTLPPIGEVLAIQGGSRKAQLIGVKSARWRANAQGSKSESAIETVYVCFRTPRDTAEPVCDLRDLKFLVRDTKTRLCSRVGFSFALIALLLGEGISLRKSIRDHLKDVRRSGQEEDSAQQPTERDK